MYEKKEKFKNLKKIFRLCEKKGLTEDDLDMSKAKELKMLISKKLDIEVQNISEDGFPIE